MYLCVASCVCLVMDQDVYLFACHIVDLACQLFCWVCARLLRTAVLGRRAALLVSCLSWGTASCGGCARLRRDVGMKSARVVHGRLGLWRSWGEGRASEARGFPCALCCRRFSHACLVGGLKQQQNKNKQAVVVAPDLHPLAHTHTQRGLCMQGSPLIEVRWVVTLT